MPGVRLCPHIFEPLLMMYSITSEPQSNHVFPYRIILAGNNSAQNCLSQCSAFGYSAAGMEFGDECCMYPLSRSRALSLCLQKHIVHLGCGDISDITSNGGTTAPESDCATACSGDPLHICGGVWRLQLYLWNGNLNTWNKPTNIGRYEVSAISLSLCTRGAKGPSM